MMMNYESDDDLPLMPPAYDSDDEPLISHLPSHIFSKLIMRDYESDDEPLIKSVGRPRKMIGPTKRGRKPKKIIVMTEAEFSAEYDSDDEPLIPPTMNLLYLHRERKRRWNMIKKRCKKKTASEKWRDMRSVINISKRKEKQQRVKILMDKYGFKIKAYYNMNKKMLEKEFARALWK